VDLEIIGPNNTPFEGGLFIVKIIFPNNFPFKPFKLNFITKIFHPKIRSSLNGFSICHCHYLNELSIEKWAPSKSVVKIMKKLMEMIKNPLEDLDDTCYDTYEMVKEMNIKLNPQKYIETAK